jgi:metal-responsive CopG/Arc/MetJ family transcriptional regulator
MIRTQIQLTEEQSRRVKAVAERENVSMAEIIRRAVDAWLATHGEMSMEEKHRRALAVVTEMRGRFRSGHSDISVNHDAHLAEAYCDYEPRDDLP